MYWYKMAIRSDFGNVTFLQTGRYFSLWSSSISRSACCVTSVDTVTITPPLGLRYKTKIFSNFLGGDGILTFKSDRVPISTPLELDSICMNDTEPCAFTSAISSRCFPRPLMRDILNGESCEESRTLELAPIPLARRSRALNMASSALK